MGIILAWLLQVKEGEKNRFIEYIKDFRDNSKDMKYIVIAIMFVIVFYVSQRTGAGSWPSLTSILGQGFFCRTTNVNCNNASIYSDFILKK